MCQFLSDFAARTLSTIVGAMIIFAAIAWVKARRLNRDETQGPKGSGHVDCDEGKDDGHQRWLRRSCTWQPARGQPPRGGFTAEDYKLQDLTL